MTVFTSSSTKMLQSLGQEFNVKEPVAIDGDLRNEIYETDDCC